MNMSNPRKRGLNPTVSVGSMVAEVHRTHKYRGVFIYPDSSKEIGFFNPRSQLDSIVVTYWPMQLKNGGDR